MQAEFLPEIDGTERAVKPSLVNPSVWKSPPLVTLFTFAAILALLVGWNNRSEYWITAEFGWGYGLGIAGGLMMLLLLVYPLRKRLMRNPWLVLSVKNWFKLHMMLGVIGPLLILYHCNFSLGSTNSNVALACMLLMVASGLVGRYIYGKIHHGLYGKKIRLQELHNHHMFNQAQIASDRQKAIVIINQPVINSLLAYKQRVVDRKSLFKNLLNVFGLGISTRINYWLIVRQLHKDQHGNNQYIQLSKNQQNKHMASVKKHIATYMTTIRKAAGLSFYERLFSLWHMLHLPIFFMLILTGFVHVYAVHAY